DYLSWVATFEKTPTTALEMPGVAVITVIAIRTSITAYSTVVTPFCLCFLFMSIVSLISISPPWRLFASESILDLAANLLTNLIGTIGWGMPKHPRFHTRLPSSGRLLELGADVREDANHGTGDAWGGGHHGDRNQNEHHCILDSRNTFFTLALLVHINQFIAFHFYSSPFRVCGVPSVHRIRHL